MMLVIPPISKVFRTVFLRRKWDCENSCISDCKLTHMSSFCLWLLYSWALHRWHHMLFCAPTNRELGVLCVCVCRVGLGACMGLCVLGFSCAVVCMRLCACKCRYKYVSVHNNSSCENGKMTNKLWQRLCLTGACVTSPVARCPC